MKTSQLTLAQRTLVALDLDSRDEAMMWLDQLSGRCGGVKIGLQLFTMAGPEMVRLAKEKNLKVFLDLKLHDIPATVRKASKAAAQLEVDLMTVHTLGGQDMMKASVEGVQSVPGSLTKILGVTVLTSEALDSKEAVLERAQLAHESGLQGVIASPHEARKIKSQLGSDFWVITPGIRLEGDPSHDQKRVATPQYACNEGADMIVMGRSITQAKEPLKVLQGLDDRS